MGKHIHPKTCGHGGEHMVKVWVLDDKGKKIPAYFSVDGYKTEKAPLFAVMVLFNLLSSLS